MEEWKLKGNRLQREGDENKQTSKMNIAVELRLKIQGREDSRIMDFRSG